MHNNGLLSQDLTNLGINNIIEIIYNPSYEKLFQEETRPDLKGYAKGKLTKSGAIAIDTGVFTGRSPKDKYIVYDKTTKDTLWWNDSKKNKNDNQPLSQETWCILKDNCLKQLSGKRLFIIDALCGANYDTRLKIRFIMEIAWQAHFVKNMFIHPSKEELVNFKPDFLVLNAAQYTNANWQKHGLNSENFIAFNLTENIQLIGGTWYCGEMKKGLFSVMNYLLPQKGIASMHCAANVGNKIGGGDVALFFGLSGTGKTTLVTTPERQLIGDDEHGWDDNGIFNFEGGCYAKIINLSKQTEPEIYRAIRRNALLENVVVKSDGTIDFTDDSKTENTRVSYPINHIKNIVRPLSRSDHAKYIIFLTADAFGVFPPISLLTLEQTKYYFLSGFTAKLAGTERGVINPVPTFSACFSEAFLTLHPMQYSNILIKRMQSTNAKAYLVNTGWNGKGKRISLKNTRIIIREILSSNLENIESEVLPIFNLQIPRRLLSIDNNILDPRLSWTKVSLWEQAAKKLAQQFIINFEKYTGYYEAKKLIKVGPQL